MHFFVGLARCTSRRISPSRENPQRFPRARSSPILSRPAALSLSFSIWNVASCGRVFFSHGAGERIKRRPGLSIGGQQLLQLPVVTMMCRRSGREEDRGRKTNGGKGGAEARVEGLRERKCVDRQEEKKRSRGERARFAKPSPGLRRATPDDHIYQLLTFVQPLLALAATAPLPSRGANVYSQRRYSGI